MGPVIKFYITAGNEDDCIYHFAMRAGFQIEQDLSTLSTTCQDRNVTSGRMWVSCRGRGGGL